VQREWRIRFEEAGKKAQQKIEDEQDNQRQKTALQSEAQKQTDNSPLRIDEWTTHINRCIGPVIACILKRFKEGGDYYEATTFFHGARVFDPMFAAILLLLEVEVLIDKLQICNPLDNGRIINSLKKIFVNFSIISRVKEWKSKETDEILQWNFSLHKLLQVQNNADGAKGRKCHHCKKMGVVATLISLYDGKPLHLSFWCNRPRWL
jgi:hypothetical protein